MRDLLPLIGALAILLPFAIPASASEPTWQKQDSGTDASLRGICPVSKTVAWASGTKGTVLRTTDGGKYWEKVGVPDAETLDFRDIQAFDDRTAFALSSGPGDKSRIYKTVDGGKTWKLQFTNAEPKAFYDGFVFRDRKHGIAMSDPVHGVFLLLSTEDGENWKLLQPEQMPAAGSDEGGFAASGTCIARVGRDGLAFGTGGPTGGRIFLSTDRGRHWTVTPSPLIHASPAQGVFSLAFLPDGSRGVIVGGDYEHPNETTGNAAYTTDGGKTWMLADVAPSGYRSAVAFLPGTNPTVWVAVGTNGSDISWDGGKTWKPLDSENYNAVSFAPSGDGWSVGPKGHIARFTGLHSLTGPLSSARR